MVWARRGPKSDVAGFIKAWYACCYRRPSQVFAAPLPIYCDRRRILLLNRAPRSQGSLVEPRGGDHGSESVGACASRFGDRGSREQKMFGGIAFMLAGIWVGVLGEMLMARVGPEQYGEALPAACGWTPRTRAHENGEDPEVTSSRASEDRTPLQARRARSVTHLLGLPRCSISIHILRLSEFSSFQRPCASCLLRIRSMAGARRASPP